MEDIKRVEKRESKRWLLIAGILIITMIIVLGQVRAKKSVAFSQSGSELEKLDFTPTTDPGSYSFSFSIDNQSYGVLIDGVSNLILQNGNAIDYNGLLWTSILGVKDLYGQLDNLVTYTNATSDIDLNGMDISNITQIHFQTLQFESPLSSQPTCNSGQGTGGTLWPVYDGAGTTKLKYIEVCMNDNGNSYNWHNITFDGATSSSITWADAINGTLFTQAEYDTNYSTNDAIYRSFANNYSISGQYTNWTQAMNGTLMRQSNWNATNTSYYLVSNPYSYLNTTINTSYYLATNPFSFYNSTQQNILFKLNSWLNITNTVSLFYITASTGYVGINTTTPQNTLNVKGNSNVTGNSTTLMLQLTQVTALPTCSTAAGTNGSIMRNTTGLVYCRNAGTWGYVLLG